MLQMILQAMLFLMPILFIFISSLGAIACLSCIYILRIAIDTDKINIIAGGYSSEESPLFGAILPIIVFGIIILKICLRTKGAVQYVFDYVDKILFLLMFLLLFGSLYSPDVKNSLLYTFKFIALGMPFFYVTKLVIYNSDYQQEIQNFIKFIYCLAIIMAGLGGYYYTVLGNVMRMSLPGVHPIPYSLLIGQGFLMSLAIFFSKGSLIGTSSKTLQIFNIIMIFFLLFAQFLTNTRGVTIAMLLAAIIITSFNVKRLGILKFILCLSIGAGIFGYILANFDTQILFARFMNLSHDQSINERTMAYQETWTLMNNFIFFGIGTDGFKHFSSLPYPHNFFLELWGSFGILGVVISLLFLCIIVYYTYLFYAFIGHNITYQLLYTLMIFFFLETMFSFTLWMHKGLYLSLGMLSGVIFPKFLSKKSSVGL